MLQDICDILQSLSLLLLAISHLLFLFRFEEHLANDSEV